MIGPMPCEKKCAGIRNDTVAAITNRETAEVAYRYLQNRRGQKNTLIEGAVWGATAPLSPFSLGHTLPNLGNTGRYRKTKRACKAYLRRTLGDEDFAKIQAMSFGQIGLNQLRTILQDRQIDTSVLDARMGRTYHRTCWAMEA